MLNRSASLAMSTGVLKALLGKIDIERHSPSILCIFVPCQDKFDVSCVANSAVQELMRGIRQQMDSLITLPEKEMSAMALGLAHR